MSERAASRKLNRSNLRRLVRARAYTSVVQIRRYFAIEGDEMSSVEGPAGNVFVALPYHGAAILAQLWREGKIGVQLSLNVRAAVIEGIFSTEAPVNIT